MLIAFFVEEYMAFLNFLVLEFGGGVCRCFRNMILKAKSVRMTMIVISISIRFLVDSLLFVKID